jgi:hypothetical protein
VNLRLGGGDGLVFLFGIARFLKIEGNEDRVSQRGVFLGDREGGANFG